MNPPQSCSEALESMAQSIDSNETTNMNTNNHHHNIEQSSSAQDYGCGMCHEDDEPSQSSPNTYDDEDHSAWIMCDICKRWFHERCVGFEEYERSLVDKYHCPMGCRINNGPSTLKQTILRHRHKFYDAEERELPVQVGTPQFLDKFRLREASYPEAPASALKLFSSGDQLMKEFKFTEEWTTPYKVLNSKGLGLKVPAPEFTISDVLEMLKADFETEAIDVYAQHSFTMSLGRFKELWESKRDRLYNILSLEFTNTTLLELVRTPTLVHELSWVEKFWPESKKTRDEGDLDDSTIYDNSSWRDNFGPAHSELHPEHSNSKPEVDHFCLMGMGGSWTDFHIDFGGSSVWYFVHTGEKVFYLAAPTDENLRLFAEHQAKPNRHDIFFGDTLPAGQLFRVVIKQGETLFIPSGWIHSVYTPVDSLVFGGNFLHSLNIAMQLRVYGIEASVNTPERYMFPRFELTNWYAARVVLESLKDANAEKEPVDNYLLKGLEVMLPVLEGWLEERDSINVEPTFAMFGKTLKALKREYNRQMKIIKRRDASPESSDSKASFRDGVHSSPKRSPIKLKIKLSEIPHGDDGVLGPGGNKGNSNPTPMTPAEVRRKSAAGEVKEEGSSGHSEEESSLDVKKVFSGRSSRGRQVKPTSKIAASMEGERDGGHLDGSVGRENYQAAVEQNFNAQFTVKERKEMEMMERTAEKEEKLAKLEAKKPRKTTASHISKRRGSTIGKLKSSGVAAPPKLKGTVKERLAKKLKLR